MSSYYLITSVSPVLVNNDEIITVQFQTNDPGRDDWIAAYSPPDVDIALTVPVKYGCCTNICNTTDTSDPYLTTAQGSLHFNMTNLRAGIKFYYFRGSHQQPLLLNSSNTIVQFKNINQPLKSRIVPTANPDLYQLLWSSANTSTPFLKWGVSPGEYQYTVNATMSSLTKDQLCGAPANTTGWFDLGIINTANISGILNLQNSQYTKIYYVYGDAEFNYTSPEYTFYLPPLPGAQPTNRGTTLALLADLGVGNAGLGAQTVIWNEACPAAINTSMSIGHLATEGNLDAIVHTGDISYANGYLATWDFFADMVSPIASSVLYFTTIGNHEADFPGTSSIYDSPSSGGECSIVTKTMYPLPIAPNSPPNTYWWSYNIGLFHLIGISTEHNYTIGSTQYQWLEQDLANVNRSITPWILFTGHRSMYVDSDQCCFENSDVIGMQLLQNNLEALLYKYQVNVGYAGHFHSLERQSAVYQNQVVQHSTIRYDNQGNKVFTYTNPNATVWMVIGAAGHPPSYTSYNYTWSERYWDAVYGYAIVTAVNATVLQWDFIESATSQVIERVMITQNFEAWNQTNTLVNDDSNDNNSDNAIGLIVGLTLGLFFGLLVVVVVGRWYYFYYDRKKEGLLAGEGQGAGGRNSQLEGQLRKSERDLEGNPQL